MNWGTFKMWVSMRMTQQLQATHSDMDPNDVEIGKIETGLYPMEVSVKIIDEGGEKELHVG